MSPRPVLPTNQLSGETMLPCPPDGIELRMGKRSDMIGAAVMRMAGNGVGVRINAPALPAGVDWWLAFPILAY